MHQLGLMHLVFFDYLLNRAQLVQLVSSLSLKLGSRMGFNYEYQNSTFNGNKSILKHEIILLFKSYDLFILLLN